MILALSGTGVASHIQVTGLFRGRTPFYTADAQNNRSAEMAGLNSLEIRLGSSCGDRPGGYSSPDLLNAEILSVKP
jgi:hypothetical protein